MHYFALRIKVLTAAEEWCHSRNVVFLMNNTREISTTFFFGSSYFTILKNDNFWCSGQNPLYILPANTVSCFKGIFLKSCVICCWRLSWLGDSHFCGVDLISVLHISSKCPQRLQKPQTVLLKNIFIISRLFWTKP